MAIAAALHRLRVRAEWLSGSETVGVARSGGRAT
jgi:hypothetical protein